MIRLKPGHQIIIEAIDNNEYELTDDKSDIYAKHIRSNTFFWRPLSEYDGLNPVIPDRNKGKEIMEKKICFWNY